MLLSLLTGSQFGPEIQIVKGGRENPMNSSVARTFCLPTAHSFIFTHFIVYKDPLGSKPFCVGICNPVADYPHSTCLVVNNVTWSTPAALRTTLHHCSAHADTQCCGKLNMSRKYYSAIISCCWWNYFIISLMFLVSLANYTVLVSDPADVVSFFTHEAGAVLFSFVLWLQWAENKAMVWPSSFSKMFHSPWHILTF